MVQSRAVVVGASLAGLRAAEGLRRAGHDGPLTLVGAEQERPYERPPLSKQLLTGKITPASVALPEDQDLDAEWLLGTSAVALDLERRRVVLGGGEDLPFDRLVVATGAHPRTLPGFEPDTGVHYLRTLDDAVALRDDLFGSSRAVVIGAGFIGLEVAASAAMRGLDVTVLEALPAPLDRAVGAQMGHEIAAFHRRNGVDVRLGVTVSGLVGARGPRGVRLGDGTVIPAEVIVAGVGVSPSCEWLEGSGVDLADGVICDSRLRVMAGGRPRPDVVACGDVARWWHPGYGRAVRVEHWTNAAGQGPAAALSLLAGDEAPEYSPTPYFWSDQHGRKIQFVGETRPGDDVAVVEGDPAAERFVAAYGRGGRLVAALGMRRPARIMALQAMIAAGAPFPPPMP